MTIKDLVVIGAGGFGREVIWLARSLGFNIVALLDDNSVLHNESCSGIKVNGPVSLAQNFRNSKFTVALGDPRIKLKVIETLKNDLEINFATLVHPSVLNSEFVSIGEGSIITAGCIITTQVEIGRHVVLNLACTIGHDVKIGDYSTIQPHSSVSGEVVIEEGVQVGTGARIRQGLTLGRGCFVGMGSVITKDVLSETLVFGNPAKAVKRLPSFREIPAS